MFSRAESIVMKLDGIHDAASQKTVAQVLRSIPGVRSASVDRRRSVANVTFFPEKTTVMEMTQALTQAGFPVV